MRPRTRYPRRLGLIAALPTDLGILHYDHDYDLIAEKTDLSFDSLWLAAQGVL